MQVMVRNCRLIGLIDLNPKVSHSADMVVGYMNDVIDIGVAGFRFDVLDRLLMGHTLFIGLFFLMKSKLECWP